MGEKNNFFEKKNRKKLVALFLVIALSVTAFLMQLNASENEKAQLGWSGTREFTIFAVGDVTITEGGSMATGDLTLTLAALPNTVTKVNMTNPLGITETKDTVSTDSLKKPSLVGKRPESEKETEESVPDPSTQLGASGARSVQLGISGVEEIDKNQTTIIPNKPAILGNSVKPTDKISLFGTGVSFAATEYGTYVFELYDVNNVLVDRITYLLKNVLNDDALSVSLNTTGTPFYLQDQHNVYVRYVPQLIGSHEVLTIVVPPMYVMGRPPDSAPGYVVSPVQTMNLPEELYDDEASAILKTFVAESQVQYFTITFDGTITSGMSFSFDTYFNQNKTFEMGKIMLKYGLDVEKIPMRIGGYGKSMDGTILVDKDAINGTALIRDARDLFFPHHNQNVYVSQTYPGDILTESQSREPIRAEPWHYPISDISLYYAYDPAKLTPKNLVNGQVVVLDGVTYWKYTVPENELGAYYNIRGSHRYYFNYANFDFPPNTSLKEGDSISFGPMLVDYTHKGIQYTKKNAGNTQPLIIKNYENMSGFSFRFKGTPGNWGGNALDRELEQGTAGEKFYFEFSNVVGWNNNPTYVYEEGQVAFDFPYGVFPTSVYLPGTRKSVVESIEYYLVDNPGVALFDYPAKSGVLHTFNLSGDQKISKFIIHYDAIHNAERLGYTISAAIGTKNADGTLMNRVVDVEMTASIKSKNDMKTMGITSADPVYKPFTYSTVQPFKLIRYEKEDSLRFGIVDRNQSNIALYNNVESRHHDFLGAGFKKYTLLMKDYEDVAIEAMPYQGDGRLLSLVKGFTVRGLTVGTHIEKAEVYYKSNLKTNWTLAENVTGIYHYFDLNHAGGEYVTGVRVEFGTLYGDALIANLASGSSVDAQGYAALNGGQQHMVSPVMFESRRAFFENSPEEEKLALADTNYQLEYRAFTSSEAQHINTIGTPHPTLNSNKARNISTVSSYVRQGFGFNTADISINQTSQFQGGLFDIGIYSNGGTVNRNPELEYYARIYLEVHPDFSIVDIPNSTFVDIMTNSDSGNKIYIYDVYLGKNANALSRSIKMFVHPNAVAPASGIKPIVRAGISEDAFYDSYMSTNDYYDEYPYTIYTPSGNPVHPGWNIAPRLFWKFNLNYPKTISTQINSLTSVQLHSVVAGKIQAAEAIFREHEKGVLGIHGTMGNNSGGEIPHYEARFEIPKMDRKTRSPNSDNPGVPLQLTNEYNMSLMGPVEINQSLVNLNIQYLKKDGTAVTVDDNTTQADLDSVYDVIVQFDKLPDRHNEMVVIPVGTSFIKTGDDFKAYEAYVGAEARFASLPGVWGAYSLSHALKYQYESYSTTIRIGQDTQEIGRYQTAITDPTVVKIQSFYNDGGVEKELETKNIGGIFQFNRDATRITATVLKPQAFYITPANYILDENNDSDFAVTSPVGTPKILGEISIDWNDLENKLPNKYDIALYALPVVTVPDSLNVLAHTTVNVNPVIKRVADGVNIPNPPVNFYLREVSANTDPTVATVVANGNTRQINVTGHKAGESTTYQYTIENRFGEHFMVGNPIKVTVVPNYAPRSKVAKVFDLTSGSKNLGNDTFDFDIWVSADVDDDSKKFQVTGVNQNITKAVTQLQRGETHFIKELSKVGYTSLGFQVTDRGNNIPITHVKDGIYSFDLPVDASDVIITATNENSSTTLTLTKYMDPAAVAVNPNQVFEIKFSQVGSLSAPMVANLKAGESLVLPDQVFGKKYHVEETPVQDYLLDDVKIQKAGLPVGTQPTKPVPANNNLYEFELLPPQDGGEIVVTNSLAKGKGLQLSKMVTLDTELPAEAFTFTLVGPSDTFYGKVDSATTIFPAAVQWYDNAGHTGTAVDVTELKLGNYTLTENVGTNYQLDRFLVDSGAATGGATITFEVTAASSLVVATANNQVKKAGWVAVDKMIDTNYTADTMAFTLKHLLTGKEYEAKALVNQNNFRFSSWKENGNLVPANELPYGEYTLTESLEGDHYAFKKFHPASGVTFDGTGKIASFVLSATNATQVITAENELFEKGVLELIHTPDVDYGSLPVGADIDVVKRTSNVYVEVKNTLRLPATWRLTAVSTPQTATIGGSTVTLPYQVLQYSKDGILYASLASQQVIMDQSEPKVGDAHKLNWLTTDEKGITSNVWFHPDTKAGDYTSTITWSLQMAP